MRYKIICKKCKSDQVIDIDERRQINWGNADRIISGRYRLDGNWGFQCLCGNNDLLTDQEENDISDKEKPDPKEIEAVIKNLRPGKTMFVMEQF